MIACRRHQCKGADGLETFLCISLQEKLVMLSEDKERAGWTDTDKVVGISADPLDFISICPQWALSSHTQGNDPLDSSPELALPLDHVHCFHLSTDTVLEMPPFSSTATLPVCWVGLSACGLLWHFLPDPPS